MRRYDNFELDDAEEAIESNMTSLGKLVFADIHSRHSSAANSVEVTDSLTLTYENLFYMPNDIVENYSHKLITLDISHNKFCRYLVIINYCLCY